MRGHLRAAADRWRGLYRSLVGSLLGPDGGALMGRGRRFRQPSCAGAVSANCCGLVDPAETTTLHAERISQPGAPWPWFGALSHLPCSSDPRGRDNELRFAGNRDAPPLIGEVVHLSGDGVAADQEDRRSTGQEVTF